MKKSPEISQDHAQLLMSQLLDGELSSSDAAVLDEYLERHPEAQDWMENLDLTRGAHSVSPDRSKSISAIHDAIAGASDTRRQNTGNLLSFPSLIRPMAAAAAIAIVGTVSWLGLRPETNVSFEPNVVEFVATDIPGASTYIYPDEETGWTVVWVDSDPTDTDSTQG